MNIGLKLKRMRLRLGLTQEELADRTELTKGFISQLETDKTSPSIATLEDILEALGSSLSEFFVEDSSEKVIYTPNDMFEKEEENGIKICWLVPNAQKNVLEPILETLPSGTETYHQDPHEGEEFGYVLAGSPILICGEHKYRLHKGDSFSFHPSETHFVKNTSKTEAKFIWISTPPSF